MLLAEKLKAYRLILASASPRRRQLLVGCGLPFVQAEPYDVSETYPAGMPAGEVPVYLARLKSDAYPLPLASFDILVTACAFGPQAPGRHRRDDPHGRPRGFVFLVDRRFSPVSVRRGNRPLCRHVRSL